MKTKTKCLVSILLALIMLATILPMATFAVEVDGDGLVTSTTFTLPEFGYRYGNRMESCSVNSESGVVLFVSQKVYECTEETFTNVSDLVETADSYLSAGKKYYLDLKFKAHPDSAGFAPTFTAANTKLYFNGEVLEPVAALSSVANREDIFDAIFELPELEAVPLGIDFKTVTEKGGDVAPEKATFEFEVLNLNNTPVTTVTVGGTTVETDGIGSFDGKLALGSDNYQTVLNFIEEGFMVRQKQGDAKGWTYDDTLWCVIRHVDPELNSLLDGETETITRYTYDFYKGTMVDGEFVQDSELPETEMVFTNTYTLMESPETADNGILALSVVMLAVSFVGIAAVIMNKKISAR